MALPKGGFQRPQQNNAKKYQNIGAVWNRTSKDGNTEYQTVDFKVTDKEGNVVGEILFMDNSGPEPVYYKLKSAGARMPTSNSPKAPVFNLSIDLTNTYQVERLDQESSEEN